MFGVRGRELVIYRLAGEMLEVCKAHPLCMPLSDGSLKQIRVFRLAAGELRVRMSRLTMRCSRRLTAFSLRYLSARLPSNAAELSVRRPSLKLEI
jgi:hypothetical protein